MASDSLPPWRKHSQSERLVILALGCWVTFQLFSFYMRLGFTRAPKEEIAISVRAVFLTLAGTILAWCALKLIDRRAKLDERSTQS
jgi:hypothetical protein